eukprot:TRINITY_DN197_c0_g1_i1.p1 TRINITY_DN197_c0_g1~~TRINITY_DN197_c0_g1_i1.p1  ORF type:complete len:841 (+),score=304.05 TRINITY_DN197_c0_g1_i1:106-2628(+)
MNRGRIRIKNENPLVLLAKKKKLEAEEHEKQKKKSQALAGRMAMFGGAVEAKPKETTTKKPRPTLKRTASSSSMTKPSMKQLQRFGSTRNILGSRGRGRGRGGIRMASSRTIGSSSPSSASRSQPTDLSQSCPSAGLDIINSLKQTKGTKSCVDLNPDIDSESIPERKPSEECDSSNEDRGQAALARMMQARKERDTKRAKQVESLKQLSPSLRTTSLTSVQSAEPSPSRSPARSPARSPVNSRSPALSPSGMAPRRLIKTLRSKSNPTDLNNEKLNNSSKSPPPHSSTSFSSAPITRIDTSKPSPSSAALLSKKRSLAASPLAGVKQLPTVRPEKLVKDDLDFSKTTVKPTATRRPSKLTAALSPGKTTQRKTLNNVPSKANNNNNNDKWSELSDSEDDDQDTSCSSVTTTITRMEPSTKKITSSSTRKTTTTTASTPLLQPSGVTSSSSTSSPFKATKSSENSTDKQQSESEPTKQQQQIKSSNEKVKNVDNSNKASSAPKIQNQKQENSQGQQQQVPKEQQQQEEEQQQQTQQTPKEQQQQQQSPSSPSRGRARSRSRSSALSDTGGAFMVDPTPIPTISPTREDISSLSKYTVPKHTTTIPVGDSVIKPIRNELIHDANQLDMDIESSDDEPIVDEDDDFSEGEASINSAGTSVTNKRQVQQQQQQQRPSRNPILSCIFDNTTIQQAFTVPTLHNVEISGQSQQQRRKSIKKSQPPPIPPKPTKKSLPEKRGWLQRETQFMKRYVPKFCHLHDGFLDMYEVDPESRDDPKEKLWNRKVNLKTDVMFVGPAPSKKKVHTLELRTYRRTYFLQASSHVEMEEWVDLFRGSILALHSRN